MTKPEDKQAAKTEVVRAEKQGKLITKLAEQWSVEPEKLLVTLKGTAFRQKQGQPEVSNEQMMALLIVSSVYGLNPFLKQIYAFPDRNNGIVPVVGVDGWSAIVNAREEFDGHSFEDGGEGSDQYCECTIHRKDRKHPTIAREYLSECYRETGPWKSHPKRMLRHKAFIQCARMAFGLSGIYEPDEGERIIEGEIIQDASPTTYEGSIVSGIEKSRPNKTIDIEEAESNE